MEEGRKEGTQVQSPEGASLAQSIVPPTAGSGPRRVAPSCPDPEHTRDQRCVTDVSPVNADARASLALQGEVLFALSIHHPSLLSSTSDTPNHLSTPHPHRRPVQLRPILSSISPSDSASSLSPRQVPHPYQSTLDAPRPTWQHPAAAARTRASSAWPLMKGQTHVQLLPHHLLPLGQARADRTCPRGSRRRHHVARHQRCVYTPSPPILFPSFQQYHPIQHALTPQPPTAS